MPGRVYESTATKSKNGTLFAFGRCEDKVTLPVEEGGYYLFKLCENYNGKVKGGIEKKWRYVAKDMKYHDVIDIMNKRLGYKAFDYTAN